MSTAGSIRVPRIGQRVRRGLRKHLETIAGVERTKTLVGRIPYSHRTYCLLAWESAVPAAGRLVLQESPYTFREGTIEDLATLVGVETYDDRRVYEKWFDRGHRLVVALEGDQVVSYSWLDTNSAFGLHELPEYRFVVSPETWYSHEAWTLKTHRGRGLRRLVFTAELLLAHEAGMRWVLGYNFLGKHVDNILRNFERIGVPRGQVVSAVRVTHGAGLRWVREAPGHRHQAATPERLRVLQDLTPGATG